MKKIFIGIAFSAAIVCSHAQPIVTPQPSTTQTVKQNFSVGSIELSYSRPGIKGRKIYGDLVPFGKVWRTGANNATTLTFTDDVTIGGKEIKAGKYGLLSIPNATEWTLIITKDLNVTSPAAYKMENDVVRVSCRPVQIPQTIENFTIQFANITNSSCDLQLIWDNTVVILPITTNTDANVMAQIDKVFYKDTKPYYAAASYYYENGKDLIQAKAWVEKAVSDPANAKAFFMYMLKARIQEKLGDKAGAKATAEKTIALATEAKNDDYVKMATDLIKKL
ncbi:MAG: DUF2911 domain-containing protein [Chitinophagaceae bacterium]